MSALPAKAEIDECDREVRFVPQADSCVAAKSAVIGFSTARRVTGAVNTQPL
jgi:hypothetical protein